MSNVRLGNNVKRSLLLSGKAVCWYAAYLSSICWCMCKFVFISFPSTGEASCITAAAMFLTLRLLPVELDSKRRNKLRQKNSLQKHLETQYLS